MGSGRVPLPPQDLQMQMDEDARQHEELREQYNLQERRLSLLQTELEEVRSGLEGSERSRKLLEQEVVEITERHNEVNIQVGWRLPGERGMSHPRLTLGVRGQGQDGVQTLWAPLKTQRQMVSPLGKSSELPCRDFFFVMAKTQ